MCVSDVTATLDQALAASGLDYYLPGDLERQVGAFVEHYNHASTMRASTTLHRLTSTSEG